MLARQVNSIQKAAMRTIATTKGGRRRRKRKKKKKSDFLSSINIKLKSTFNLETTFANQDRIKQQQQFTKISPPISQQDRIIKVILMAILTSLAITTISAERRSFLNRRINSSEQISATLSGSSIEAKRTMSNDSPSNIELSHHDPQLTEHLSPENGWTLEKGSPQNRWQRHLIQPLTSDQKESSSQRDLRRVSDSVDPRIASPNGMNLTVTEAAEEEANTTTTEIRTKVRKRTKTGLETTKDGSNQDKVNSKTAATTTTTSHESSSIIAQANSSSAGSQEKVDQQQQQQQDDERRISTFVPHELNQSNSTDDQAANLDYYRHSFTVSAVITIAYTIVFIVGIVGNSFVVAIVCKSPRMRTVTNYFIVNLAFADILVLLFCLPATLVGNLFIRK